jgi:hypothetical protein
MLKEIERARKMREVMTLKELGVGDCFVIKSTEAYMKLDFGTKKYSYVTNVDGRITRIGEWIAIERVLFEEFADGRKEENG